VHRVVQRRFPKMNCSGYKTIAAPPPASVAPHTSYPHTGTRTRPSTAARHASSRNPLSRGGTYGGRHAAYLVSRQGSVLGIVWA
jgi:hypothetical protein